MVSEREARAAILRIEGGACERGPRMSEGSVGRSAERLPSWRLLGGEAVRRSAVARLEVRRRDGSPVEVVARDALDRHSVVLPRDGIEQGRDEVPHIRVHEDVLSEEVHDGAISSRTEARPRTRHGDCEGPDH